MAVGSLPLTITSATTPTAKAELDPTTGRPCLNASLKLDLKLDIADLLQLLVTFAAEKDVTTRDTAEMKVHPVVTTAAAQTKAKRTEKAARESKPSEMRAPPARSKDHNWTWADPMYANESWILEYAQRPDVRWCQEELSSAGESFVAITDEDQRRAFQEMEFEPLPVPERTRVSHANFKDADAIRYPPASTSDTAASSSQRTRPSASAAQKVRESRAPPGLHPGRGHTRLEDQGRLYAKDCKSQ